MSVTRPKPDGRDVPAGFELVAVVDEQWGVWNGDTCRYARKGHHVCGKPSAAVFVRGTTHKQLWRYCPEHMYGRWVEDGKVMHWILRKIEVTPERWQDFVEGHGEGRPT